MTDYMYIEDNVQMTIEERAKKMNDEIVDRLIAYRELSGKTQQEVADAIGIPLIEVERIESKEYMAPVEKLIKYAKSLGVELKFDMVKPEKKSRKLPLPIGVSNFKKVSEEYCYVDKTLLIRDVLDSHYAVTLFTRPRRFGKSLNMDMLRVYFEQSEEDTSVYFKNKNIWKCGKEYQEHQGKYPVIFFTFKDVKFKTWEDCVSYFKLLFATEFNRHPELFHSDKCSEYEKKYFYRVAMAEATTVDLTYAFLNLSRMLCKHHNEKVIIMIDEYDTPIQQGYMRGYYDEAIVFMRNLFSGGFKDNPYLKYGFLTGILRVAKESLFSSLNNLKVNTVLDNQYSNYFGFTTNEVRDLAEYYGADDKMTELIDWYDGYRFGDTDIFNPWSVLEYFDNGCLAGPYWVWTASNDMIGEILSDVPDKTRQELRSLLYGETVSSRIDTSVIYPNIKKKPSSLYSFLLVTGYLKVSKRELVDGEYLCKVAIPNKELRSVYKKEILAKLDEVMPPTIVESIHSALYDNDVDELKIQLRKLLLQTVSYNDAASESFYHGFILGLCAMLESQYFVTSNRESGEGRFDIQLFPRKKNLPGILIEVKAQKQGDKETLKNLAQSAFNQIETKSYDTEMKMRDVKEIVKYGVAFCGKQVEVVTG